MVQTLITIVIATIGMTAMSKWAESQLRFSQSVSRITDSARVSDNLNLILLNAENCEDAFVGPTGDRAFFNSRKKAYVSEIRLKGVPFLKLGARVGDHTVDSIVIEKLEDGTDLPGATEKYIKSNLKVHTSRAHSKAMSMGNYTMSFAIIVKTQASVSPRLKEQIVSCYRDGGTQQNCVKRLAPFSEKIPCGFKSEAKCLEGETAIMGGAIGGTNVNLQMAYPILDAGKIVSFYAQYYDSGVGGDCHLNHLPDGTRALGPSFCFSGDKCGGAEIVCCK